MFAAQWGVERDPPSGLAGLVVLVSALRRFRAESEGDEDDERVMVELAGAYLAVLLADALGQGHHVSQHGRHGLALGTRGFFDPFAAVELALDADDVQKSIARSVRDAELEAHDEGPISRVVLEVERQLKERGDGLSLYAQFGSELELRVDGMYLQLDARAAVRVCRDESPTVVRRAVSKLLRALPSFAAPATFGEIEDTLLPRVVGPTFLRGLGDAAQRHALCTVPLSGELHVAFILRGEGRARFVHAEDLHNWDVPLDSLHRIALANLARGSAQARLFRADGDEGTFVVARTGDGLDSSRLLLPGLHALLAPELGTPFAVGVPHRDALFACPLDRGRSLHELALRVREEAAGAAHAISPELFALHAGGELVPLSRA